MPTDELENETDGESDYMKAHRRLKSAVAGIGAFHYCDGTAFNEGYSNQWSI